MAKGPARGKRRARCPSVRTRPAQAAPPPAGAVFVAAGGIGNDERTACDRCPAFGGDGDGQAAARRRTAAHAARPSWSVSFIAGVTLTKSGRIATSGSPPSSAGGHRLTATMAAPGAPSITAREERKIVVLAAGQGREGGFVFVGDVGSHGVDPRGVDVRRIAGSRRHSRFDRPPPDSASAWGPASSGRWDGARLRRHSTRAVAGLGDQRVHRLAAHAAGISPTAQIRLAVLPGPQEMVE